MIIISFSVIIDHLAGSVVGICVVRSNSTGVCHKEVHLKKRDYYLSQKIKTRPQYLISEIFLFFDN